MEDEHQDIVSSQPRINLYDHAIDVIYVAFFFYKFQVQERTELLFIESELVSENGCVRTERDTDIEPIPSFGSIMPWFNAETMTFRLLRNHCDLLGKYEVMGPTSVLDTHETAAFKEC